MGTISRRLDRIEWQARVQQIQRDIITYTPAGLPPIGLLNLMIAFLEKSPEEQERQYPGYPAWEWRELRARLPVLREIRREWSR
jgi:hypothetical protein